MGVRASAVAVASTVNVTLQMISGAVTVTGRVSGDAAEAVMTCSDSLDTSKLAAQTAELKLTVLILSWPATVLNLRRKVLMEYVPAYACTSTVNWSPACSGYAGKSMVIPGVWVLAGITAAKVRVPRETAGALLPTSLYATLTCWSVAVNQAVGSVTEARQWPAGPEGVQVVDARELLNDTGDTCTSTGEELTSVL
jgi:hypothetical protein